MNLIYQLRNLFTLHREAALPTPASSCGELLSNLDELCARLNTEAVDAHYLIYTPVGNRGRATGSG